jgi:hypothetical protein
LLIPRESVFIRNGQSLVEVLENGKSTSRTITTGSKNDNEIVVASGLREGDRITRSPKVR